MGKPSTVQARFQTALDTAIAQIKEDRSILAVILCGSLSHDVVWEKSDIDLVLVTVDDRKLKESSRSLVEQDINIHAYLMPRAEFKKMVEGAIRNSFIHSLLAKGRLLYTHDSTIADLCSTFDLIGQRDTEIQLLRAGINVLPMLYKAQKWFYVRQDLDYAALWLLYAATPLAQIEVFSRRLLADREVIPQAMTLNPEFFSLIYANLLNKEKTTQSIQTALEAIDVYLEAKTALLFQPIFDYLQEAGEVRSSTEIDRHFQTHMNVNCVTTACEYLSDRGLITKASSPVKLTKLSNLEMQELAFFYLGDPPDDF